MSSTWVVYDGPKPAPVEDPGAFWGQAPPQLSPRCAWWLRQIMRGWRPSRRIRGMGYDGAARWFGVWIWEFLNVIWPALSEGRSDVCL